MKITIDELAKMFPLGVPIMAIKILFPEKSEPLTTFEVRSILMALSSYNPHVTQGD